METNCVLCGLRAQSSLSSTGKLEAKFCNIEDVM